tara:strand:- start:495 stop:944 length:450 start_codon:yes stop_codon:yes gene_type:complete
MSIRNLTEEGNGIVLRCLNSELSSGWYLPTLIPAAQTTITDFTVKDHYYQIRQNVVHISGVFSCKSTTTALSVECPLPEGIELPDNRWTGVGHAVSANATNTGHSPLFLFDVERLPDRNIIKVIFENSLRVIDTQLVDKTYHFRLSLYR